MAKTVERCSAEQLESALKELKGNFRRLIGAFGGSIGSKDELMGSPEMSHVNVLRALVERAASLHTGEVSCVEGVEDEFVKVGEYFLGGRVSTADGVEVRSRTSAMSIVSWVTVRSSPSSDDVLTAGKSPRVCKRLVNIGLAQGCASVPRDPRSRQQPRRASGIHATQTDS